MHPGITFWFTAIRCLSRIGTATSIKSLYPSSKDKIMRGRSPDTCRSVLKVHISKFFFENVSNSSNNFGSNGLQAESSFDDTR